MITTAAEYNANLHLINNANPPVFAQLPQAENIYNIDIKTREIDPPQFLTVEGDHISETIYFVVDRYAEYMDLSETCCIIYYINAEKERGIYCVPFYDIYTLKKENKMLIPWCIDRIVSASFGNVEFAITFFKVETQYEPNLGSMEPVITYRLNTLPATSRVLKGIDKFELDKEEPFYDKFTEWQEQFAASLNQLGDMSLKWTKAEVLLNGSP